MWHNTKFFKYGTGLLLLLLIIYVSGNISFFWAPFGKFIGTIFTPILISGFIYYIFRPIVKLFLGLKLPKFLCVILTFAVVILAAFLIIRYTGNILVEQFTQLLKDIPSISDSASQTMDQIIKSKLLEQLPISDITNNVAQYLEKISRSFGSILLSTVSTLTGIGTIVITSVFLLFYFLKDDEKFFTSFVKRMPKKYGNDIEKMLRNIDEVLSAYISSQMLVALSIGVLMYIGYLIVGLKYSLIMAIFATVTCIIPFFGPWLGIVPAILIGLTMNPWMPLKIIAIMMVVQQIDEIFITPNIMQKNLDIHPIVVILVLIGASAIYGIAGLIVAVPVYAALKITVINLYKIYTSRHTQKKPG